MPDSVIITEGAKNWQIFQQQNGFADITISGTHADTENPQHKGMDSGCERRHANGHRRMADGKDGKWYIFGLNRRVLLD